MESGQANDGVQFRLLKSQSDPLFWPTLELYVESFPRDEREELHKVARVCQDDPDLCQGDRRRLHMAVAEVDGRLAGIRYFAYYAEPRLGFFIYLAVDPSFRRLGIGSQLIDFAKAACNHDAINMGSGLDAILFECERPELATTPTERKLREDRLTFFQNRGAVIVSTEYYQPALGPDREPVPLYLLGYAVAPAPDWRRLVTYFHRSILGYPPHSKEELGALNAIKA